MKKAKLLATGAFLMSLGWAAAQVCTPDAQYTSGGIHPPCNVFEDTAYTGQTYSEIITIVVPSDTTVPLLGTLTINSLVLNSVNGLPTGLTNYQCEPANCTFPGGTSGCVLLSGIPSQLGSFPLAANTTVNVQTLGAIPISYNYCTLIVKTPVLVKEYSNNFSLADNTPNPFTESTVIQFIASSKSIYNFKVYDLLGRIIHSRKINALPGNNRFDFYSKGLNPGIYIYSLESNGTTETRRMTVVQE